MDGASLIRKTIRDFYMKVQLHKTKSSSKVISHDFCSSFSFLLIHLCNLSHIEGYLDRQLNSTLAQ